MSNPTPATVDQIYSDLAGMRQTVEKIAEAVTRLAVIEERQSAQISTTSRIFNRIDTLEGRVHKIELSHPGTTLGDLDDRVRELEKVSPISRQSNETIGKVVQAVLMAAVGAVLSLVIAGKPVLPSHQAQAHPETQASK